MAKGIIYVMETVVPGLVKIGKTGTGIFEGRMYSPERNGYFNVVGLKRRFAIEVEGYDEKEALFDEIFSKARVPNSELFALDIDLVIQLLASFDGEQVYSETETREESFDLATEQRHMRDDWFTVPDGTYRLKQSRKGKGKAVAEMVVEDGAFIVKAGAKCLPVNDGVWAPEPRRTAPTVDGVLQVDVVTKSPSTAGWIVLGCSNNGWHVWKDGSGKTLDEYRKK